MYPNIQHNIKKGRDIWYTWDRREIHEKETSTGKPE